MVEMTSGRRLSIVRLIFIPSVITLAVTLLRVTGELKHWSPILFNPAPGGGGAIMGITWLVLIFGVYFALKLSVAGEGPSRIGKANLFAVVGLVAMLTGAFVGFAHQIQFPGKVVMGLLVIVAAAALQFLAWPALFKVLLAYGYAARIPVAIVMFFAVRGNWGTHYDALPPDFPDKSFWPKYLQIALVPQLIFWIAFTVIIGTLFGSIATAIFGRRKLASPAHW
jgi:hypothetical protein